MGATVKSTEFVDDNVLFATKQSANSWRLSMTVDSSNTIAEGVAKQAAHVADIATVGGDSGTTAVTAGASVSSDPTTIPTIGDAYDAAEIKAAFKQMSENLMNKILTHTKQDGIDPLKLLKEIIKVLSKLKNEK